MSAGAPSAGLRDRLAPTAPLLLAALAAAFVCADPALSGLLPRHLWQLVWLDAMPLRVALVAASVAVLGVAVAPWLGRGVASAQQAGVDAPRLAVVLFLIGMQVGGLKVGPIDALDLLIPAALAMGLFRELGPRARGFVIPGVVFFGLALVAIEIPHFFVTSPITSALGMFRLARYVLLALLLVNLIRDAATLRFALDAVVAVAVVSAVLGIAQALLFLLGGIPIVIHDDPEEAWKNTPFGYALRATALNPTAQQLSGFLLLALPVMLFDFFERVSAWRRFATGCGIAILLVAIVLTWNYSAMVAVAVMIPLFPYLRWPQLAIHVTLGYVLAAAAVYYSGLGAVLYDTVYETIMTGVGQRMTLFHFGLEKLMRDPWIGEGLGGFQRFSGNYWRRAVHSAPMRAWTELGFAGLVVFMTMVLTSMTQIGILARRADGPWRRHVRALLLTWLGFFVYMQADPSFDSSIFWTLLALVQAVVIIEARRSTFLPWRSSARPR